MTSKKSAVLLFPNQLFEEVLSHDKSSIIFLIEDDLFFKQFRFHKQKLMLHRASMKEFERRLRDEGFAVEYIETSDHESMTLLAEALKKHDITQIEYFDLVDDWLEQRIERLIKEFKLTREISQSPAFLTSRGALDGYFADHPNRMQNFYEWQRKRLNVLVDNGKPVGGKWSFDEKNRKPLPKDIMLPLPYTFQEKPSVQAAKTWVNQAFAHNPGSDDFSYPVTHVQAHGQLEHFLDERFALFGPYEDAIARNQSQLFHSILSPLLNTGLLTPRQVVTRTLQYVSYNDIPIESVEGFIRQIIGWREYMRATYVRYGRKMRSKNSLGHTNKLKESWWNGTVGIDPIDRTIGRVLNNAYAHHIERLMILGNSMLLLRINPDDVYEWFMSLFIDAYDWVMVPNVYAMSQFAADDMITTKPYISGSNYIIKMSDYKKDDWSEIWDALYWRFIADHRDVFENNYRSKMMVSLYDKLPLEKKLLTTRISNEWVQ